jgi:hypothetical protein
MGVSSSRIQRINNFITSRQYKKLQNRATKMNAKLSIDENGILVIHSKYEYYGVYIYLKTRLPFSSDEYRSFTYDYIDTILRGYEYKCGCISI